MTPINIAVASGKGGTGKTMVSTSLAASLAPEHKIQFLDCDVEAPNAHLFLKPKFSNEIQAAILVPEIDLNLCTHCGKCVEECSYHALAELGDQILLFPQLCHGCGNCMLICPVNAITEKPRSIGRISRGRTEDGIHYLMGELTISEPMPTPIIHQLKSMRAITPEITILDSPPGASCAVVETIHDADFILLVTEPTPFGLHDLKQMLGILETIKIPAGVIINRVGIGNDEVQHFLRRTGFPVLMEIPFQQRIASELAKGNLFVSACSSYRNVFSNLYNEILKLLVRKADPS